MKPTPQQFTAARALAGQTFEQVAEVTSKSLRTVKNWADGTHKMQADTWELYLHKCGLTQADIDAAVASGDYNPDRRYKADVDEK